MFQRGQNLAIGSGDTVQTRVFMELNFSDDLENEAIVTKMSSLAVPNKFQRKFGLKPSNGRIKRYNNSKRHWKLPKGS